MSRLLVLVYCAWLGFSVAPCSEGDVRQGQCAQVINVTTTCHTTPNLQGNIEVGARSVPANDLCTLGDPLAGEIERTRGAHLPRPFVPRSVANVCPHCCLLNARASLSCASFTPSAPRSGTLKQPTTACEHVLKYSDLDVQLHCPRCSSTHSLLHCKLYLSIWNGVSETKSRHRRPRCLSRIIGRQTCSCRPCTSFFACVSRFAGNVACTPSQEAQVVAPAGHC
jgi:hypothetical protein